MRRLAASCKWCSIRFVLWFKCHPALSLAYLPHITPWSKLYMNSNHACHMKALWQFSDWGWPGINNQFYQQADCRCYIWLLVVQCTRCCQCWQDDASQLTHKPIQSIYGYTTASSICNNYSNAASQMWSSPSFCQSVFFLGPKPEDMKWLTAAGCLLYLGDESMAKQTSPWITKGRVWCPCRKWGRNVLCLHQGSRWDAFQDADPLRGLRYAPW